MATEEWLQAARNYSLLSEPERAAYWQQLNPEQQALLQDALRTGSGPTAPGAAVGPASAPPRRGCGGPLAAGCLGMILGCLLTLAVEFAAVMMGVQAVTKAFHDFSGSSSPAERVSREPSPPEEKTKVGCDDPTYRDAHLLECDPGRWCDENYGARHRKR